MKEAVTSTLRRVRARARAELKSARARVLSAGAGVVWRIRQARWRVAASRAADEAPAPPAPAPAAPQPVDVVFAADGAPGPSLDTLIRFTRPPAMLFLAGRTADAALAAFGNEQGIVLADLMLGTPGHSPYVAFVSPSVTVTHGWLEPLAAALERDPSLDAVVPWSEEALPPFAAAWGARMGAGGGVHPRLDHLPVACALVRRSALDAASPREAAERAASRGRLALVEESLVLGAPSPAAAPDRLLRGLAIRRDALARRAALREEGLARFEGKSVLFVLPVADRGGGANVVLSEAAAMAAMGVDARVLNVTPLRPYFEKGYPDPGVPTMWAFPDAIPDAARRFDAVVATANTSVPWIAALAGKGPILGYYVQDYEPWFYPDDAFKRSNAVASYTLVPGMRLVTKTTWNRDIVRRETGAEAAVVGPSFDADLHRPRRPAPPDAPLRIAAMVRPASPRRAPERTMRVLSRAARALGEGVTLLTFGVAADDPQFLALPRDFPHTHLGVLDDRTLADLLGSVHVFADFSDFQAMGLTALEAMGCSATAVLPEAGGASSFATHERDALLVDTRSEDACLDALLRLARDGELRQRLMRAAPEVGTRFSVEACALATLSALFPDA